MNHWNLIVYIAGFLTMTAGVMLFGKARRNEQRRRISSNHHTPRHGSQEAIAFVVCVIGIVLASITRDALKIPNFAQSFLPVGYLVTAWFIMMKRTTAKQS
ncbi:MAG: hypothetical protein WC477_04325 [Patescibacteria group bacterium]